jgi:RNA polymerase sigma-70 factor (sigma-E family)
MESGGNQARRRFRRASRDEEFVAFASASAPRLQQAAYLMCRDWHVAQDLTQDTLAKMYVSWGRITRGVEDRYAYARTVLLRLILDQRRLRRSSETVVELTPEIAQPPAEPVTRLSLLPALALLSPRDRAIVVLRYWEDQSVESTAQTLDISPAVVRTQSSRALAVLRQHLRMDKEILLQ